ncbi:hypothetical protein AN189_04995 [Loktanella sp. 3ANDIMAR09]|uniref:DUF2059 domain-containing protein n=1 Tax=Loktanella sp. 3ANDIMAR09 TaxID=1225657 RepID=UPI0006FF85E1|nr:DUF2059 domain-containing protein [Loktanella sp. 3ANDIMAR09]KQI69832.1 hypothetical protein AN189_04995 [Loktanella sp. 3ANDIMAR09]
MFSALRQSTLIAALVFGSATVVTAQDIDPVYDALRMDELVTILRAEGLHYGDDIAAELFNGPVSGAWDGAVDAVFDTTVMADTLRSGLAAGLDDTDTDAIVAFYDSPLGQQITTLELSAREAFLDETIEEAATEAAAIAVADGGPRIDQMNAYLAANDVIEQEVTSTMNASVAFYMGLMDGGALPPSLTEDEVLRDVYSRQDEIRRDVTSRVYAFLYLAYDPLSDADIDAYITFMESQPGQALSRATYAAFDAYYIDASRQLALAAAAQMRVSDL